MEHNKAPGPDSFPAEFYQNFWDVVKPDLLDLFSCLHSGQLELFRLNFGEIVLLPKVNEADFTKVATIRLNSVPDHVVRPSQTTFMQERNIIDGVVILHETVRELHRKNLNGVI